MKMSLPKAGVVVVKAVYHVYLEPEEMLEFMQQPDSVRQVEYLSPSSDDLIEMEVDRVDYE